MFPDYNETDRICTYYNAEPAEIIHDQQTFRLKKLAHDYHDDMCEIWIILLANSVCWLFIVVFMGIYGMKILNMEYSWNFLLIFVDIYDTHFSLYSAE